MVVFECGLVLVCGLMKAILFLFMVFWFVGWNKESNALGVQHCHLLQVLGEQFHLHGSWLVLLVL